MNQIDVTPTGRAKAPLLCGLDGPVWADDEAPGGEPPTEDARVRVESDTWRDLLITKNVKRGDVEVTVVMAIAANVQTIFRFHPMWMSVIAYDAFAETVVTVTPPPWHPADAPAQVTAGAWSDVDSSRASHWLARVESLNVSPRVVDEAVAVVASSNVVHPVREWLAGLQWDHEPRIDRLFVNYFGAEDSAYNRGVGARFMIGAVARVNEPGAKVDCTPVLEGPQGIGKSTGVRKLAGDAWFFDTPIIMGEKDGYQSLRGKWIGELGELHALNRADLNRAKNFLTATVDNYRPSYGRRSRDFPRQCVFIGTTNATEYLRDETGNRRFLPIRCGQVAFDAIARDRDQLWAEASVRYSDGERWHVDTSEFASQCAAEQEARFVADAWEAPVLDWIMSEGHPERRIHGVTTGEVLTGALSMSADKWAKPEQDRVAAIMRRRGWERGKQTRAGDGKRERRWRQMAELLVTLVTGDAEGVKTGQLVTLVTDPVTELVTQQSPNKTSMSPASPADPSKVFGINNRSINTLHGNAGDTGDAGDGEVETDPDDEERLAIQAEADEQPTGLLAPQRRQSRQIPEISASRLPDMRTTGHTDIDSRAGQQ